MKQFLCGIAAVALVAAVGIKIILTVVGFAIFLLMALSGVVTTGDSKPKPPSPLPPNRHRDPRLPLPIIAAILAAMSGCYGPLYTQTRASTPTLAGNASTTYTSVGGVINTASVESPDGQELFRSCLTALGFQPDRAANAPPPSAMEVQVRAACIGYMSNGGTSSGLNSLMLANNAGWQSMFLNQYAGLGLQTGLINPGYNYGTGAFGNGRFRKQERK